MDYLVRWLIKGMYIKGTVAYPRFPGDEDVMARSEARAYAAPKMVKIIGEANKVIPKIGG